MCLSGYKDTKTAWRPRAVTMPTTHNAGPIKPEYIWILANISELRGHHYYYKSVEDSQKKTRDWGQPDPLAGAVQVQGYWNSIRDISLWRFVPRLSSAMMQFLT